MNKGPIRLDGTSLSVENIVEVARFGRAVELPADTKDKVNRCASHVEKWVTAQRPVYGISTGFGDLAAVAIPPDKSEALQRNLLLSHSCGLGELLPDDVVRAAMLLRINTLSRGYSGIRAETLSLLAELLNRGVIPLVPEQGSLGASGDLCPLSHIACVLIGEGEAFFHGERMPARKALAEAGLEPVTLRPKEGLALNNGTTVMNAMAALGLHDGLNLLKVADIAGALSFEALHGVPHAYDERTHLLRPHAGQLASAKNLRRLIEDSDIVRRFGDSRVQDAYSLRCIPQVHGASRDAFNYVRDTVNVEINSVTDNPIIFPDDDIAISGGNFHGQPLAIAMDLFGIAIAELASIAERRVARLIDSKLSGLPPFLVEGSGVNSGFMIAHYTAAAIVSENKVLAHPSCVDTIPTSATQEDHVSMGGYSARKALTILRNSTRVIGIELLCAAQGVDFSKPDRPGKGTAAAYDALRERIDFVENDVFLHPIMLESINMVEDGRVLKASEQVVGELD